jgi:hypothetical protein
MCMVEEKEGAIVEDIAKGFGILFPRSALP